MKDENKTKKQLISELIDLRRQIAKGIKAESERSPREEEHEKLEARLRTAIESLPFDFFGIDVTGHYFIQNTTCKMLWGDIIGKRPEDLSVDKNTLSRRLDIPYLFYDSCTGKHYKDVRTGFQTALRKSGIRDFRFHDLRHTFASHLVMAGVDLKAVQELLGHKRIRMTLRYSHLSQAHKEKAVATLDHVWTEKTNYTKTIQSEEQKECLSAVSY